MHVAGEVRTARKATAPVDAKMSASAATMLQLARISGIQARLQAAAVPRTPRRIRMSFMVKSSWLTQAMQLNEGRLALLLPDPQYEIITAVDNPELRRSVNVTQPRAVRRENAPPARCRLLIGPL